MVPNVVPRGHSFKGVTAYLLNPKDGQTEERVVWSKTHNLHTDDIEKASRWMAWTDINRESLKPEDASQAGRPATAGNVYHFSLSWAPGEAPSQEHMEASALAAVERLGLSHHQLYMVAHDDTEHQHVHLVVNLVDPNTGKIADIHRDHDKLDRWAHEYELEHGIQCEDRAAKFAALDRGELGHPVQSEAKQRSREDYERGATEAYQASDSAQAFVAALEAQGLSLAQGQRRGFVVVDERGDIFALANLVEGAKTKDITARLKGVDREALPMADALQAERQAQEVSRGEGDGAAVPAAETTQDTTTTRSPDHDQKTTAQLAQEYEQLCQDPLRELRGGMDADGRGQGGDQEVRGVPAGSPGPVSGADGLRPLPAEAGANGPREYARDNPEQYSRPLTPEAPALITPQEQARERARARWEAVSRAKDNWAGKAGYWDRQSLTNDEAIAQARDFYRIDALREEHARAQDTREKTSGFWGWLTGRQKQADQDLQVATQNLQNAEMRFREVMELRLRYQTEAAKQDELAKQGLKDQAGAAKAGQERDSMEAEAQRQAKDDHALKEAAASPERAAELKDAIQPKTAQQRDLAAFVKTKAREHEDKQAGTKKAEADKALSEKLQAAAKAPVQGQPNLPQVGTPAVAPLPETQPAQASQPARKSPARANDNRPGVSPRAEAVRPYSSYTREERDQMVRQEILERLAQSRVAQEQGAAAQTATPSSSKEAFGSAAPPSEAAREDQARECGQEQRQEAERAQQAGKVSDAQQAAPEPPAPEADRFKGLER